MVRIQSGPITVSETIAYLQTNPNILGGQFDSEIKNLISYLILCCHQDSPIDEVAVRPEQYARLIGVNVEQSLRGTRLAPDTMPYYHREESMLEGISFAAQALLSSLQKDAEDGAFSGTLADGLRYLRENPAAYGFSPQSIEKVTEFLADSGDYKNIMRLDQQTFGYRGRSEPISIYVRDQLLHAYKRAHERPKTEEMLLAHLRADAADGCLDGTILPTTASAMTFFRTCIRTQQAPEGFSIRLVGEVLGRLKKEPNLSLKKWIQSLKGDEKRLLEAFADDCMDSRWTDQFTAAPLM